MLGANFADFPLPLLPRTFSPEPEEVEVWSMTAGSEFVHPLIPAPDALDADVEKAPATKSKNKTTATFVSISN